MQNYPYAGQPLNEVIGAILLGEGLRQGTFPRRFTRAQAEKYVTQAHVLLGGVPDARSNRVSLAGILQQWKSLGVLENSGSGWFVWVREVVHEEQEGNEAEHECYPTECVYAFYYPADRALALLQNRSVWPCKVGRTARHAAQRISEQTNGHYHSRPVVGLVWPTDNAAGLEKVAHAMLELRGRRMENSVGTEWFYTNPEELTTMLAQLEAE